VRAALRTPSRWCAGKCGGAVPRCRASRNSSARSKFRQSMLTRVSRGISVPTAASISSEPVVPAAALTAYESTLRAEPLSSPPRTRQIHHQDAEAPLDERASSRTQKAELLREGGGKGKEYLSELDTGPQEGPVDEKLFVVLSNNTDLVCSRPRVQRGPGF
jgi:hypothetical protein